MDNRKRMGFTMVELMIVVGVIGLLAVLAIPSYVRAREFSFAQSCINNLRQIDAAKDIWAFENQQPTGASVTGNDLGPYLKRGYDGVKEPVSGSYTIGNVGTDPSCSKYDVTLHPSTI